MKTQLYITVGNAATLFLALILRNYALEQKYEQIIRDDGYEIAKMGNIEFLKYAILTTCSTASHLFSKSAL